MNTIDQFAAAALTGILAAETSEDPLTYKEGAKRAWLQALAMMHERHRVYREELYAEKAKPETSAALPMPEAKP